MKCLDQLREAVEAVYSGAPRFEISLINCSALVRMRQVLGSDVDWLLHSMIVRGEVLRESEGESVGKLKKLLPLLKTGTPSGRDLNWKTGFYSSYSLSTAKRRIRCNPSLRRRCTASSAASAAQPSDSISISVGYT
jgi:hypothetical protein